MTTVAEALRTAASRLESVSDTARLDVELLMAHALGVSRTELLLRHMHGPVPEGFAALTSRRERHEPLAYIVGRQEFYGRDFAVSPAVLIPRADSETIVAAALAACPAPGRVLDCGVGSGALLLTVLCECPGASGVGIDRSPEALSIARRNASLLEVADRAVLEERDWHLAQWAEGLGSFDLILANPPYVESDAALDPDVRDWEPAGALFAGPEGLDDYRILIPQLRSLLKENGVVVLEIGSAQAPQVSAIATEAGFSTELHHDLAHRPRALVLRLGLGKAIGSH
jgi:release factor glutamine methyltransferase